jgi:hypothetical protein
VSEVNLEKWSVVRTLEAGPVPEHMAFAADEKTIFVGNPNAGTVSAVSVASGKVARVYKIGENLHGLDIGDDGRTLFVSSQKENLLVALDPQTGTQRKLTLAPAPYHLNTIRGTGKVYVSSRKEPKVWVVDQKTLAVTATIAFPAGEGHQMAISVMPFRRCGKRGAHVMKPDRPRVGVVLSSGGVRGVYAHTGFMLALERLGIPVAAAAGCSAGAVVGGIAASGTDLQAWSDALARVDRRRFWTPDPWPVLLWQLVVKKGRGYSGLSGTDAAMEFCRRQLAVQTFEEVTVPCPGGKPAPGTQGDVFARRTGAAHGGQRRHAGPVPAGGDRRRLVLRRRAGGPRADGCHLLPAWTGCTPHPSRCHAPGGHGRRLQSLTMLGFWNGCCCATGLGICPRNG